MTGVGDAGASAAEQAELFESAIDSAQRQVVALLEAVRELRRSRRAWDTGAAGERAVAAHVQQVMVDLGSTDWHLLADRRWPGTRRGNLDLVLVGPPGVLVLDVKAWREVAVHDGHLWHGQQCEDEALDDGRRAAAALAELLATEGLAPASVRPMVVLAGRRQRSVDLDGVLVVGELDLHAELARLGARLEGEQVAAVVRAVDEGCPPASRHGRPQRRSVRATDAHPAQDPLLDIEAVWSALLDEAEREPIEAWMTWLHPAQAQLVTRAYSGPARVRGAAGTGKTVVALHRARELAGRPDARVLVTSYVRTLPDVQAALFARLAPERRDRVEFRGLHSWAVKLLRARGADPAIAERGGRPLFDAAWHRVGARSVLATAGPAADYWWDEIQYVIKGRGLDSLEAYLGLLRIGRRTALQDAARRAVWTLYEEYERLRLDAGAVDWGDVLLLALASVRSQPLDPAYTAVIVDEVQDLTCVGLRLLHALVGDAPDGLYLVGDGQQAVYPGGFTLREAGVSVTGRATVLERNYRNRAEILAAALEVVRGDAFDDLEDDDSLPGTRDVEMARPGGVVLRVVADDDYSQQLAVLSALRAAHRDGVRLGDMAVLVGTNRAAENWLITLSRAGVPALLLKDYDGMPTEQVKVGTYQRSKGTEFACVFLPDHDRAVREPGGSEGDEASGERAELQRRCLFVAMTRARDRLWLGAVRRT